MSFHIVEYDKNQHYDLWNEFVLKKSSNGTIFHTQLFLSYHFEKFNDASILIFDNEKLYCVLLACKTDKGFFSHKGTSGGGPVFLANLNEFSIVKITKLILEYYKNKIEFFIPEEIFSSINNGLLIKTLSNNKELILSKSAYFDLNNEISISNKRLITGINSTINSDILFKVTDKDEDYINYYNVIQSNLVRYNARPIHSEKEFISLKNIIHKHQFLYCAYRNNKIIAGIWVIKATDFAWHTQYIAKDYSEKQQYIIPTLLINLKEIARNNNQKIVSLGSCDGGKSAGFSESLCNFKLKLGSKLCNRYKILDV